MSVCDEYNCYFGRETEQLPRTSALLKEVTKTRFTAFHLREALDEAMKIKDDKKTKNKKKNKK